jgi:DNA polymerase IV
MIFKEIAMVSRIILHIDMNSYFASVEQQANPFLRGKPVGVCAYLSPGGCIIASSMEAKQKGIKTGCTVREARELDPNVVIIENEPAKYRSTTEKLYSILKSYTDKMEPYSIDEAFLDLTGLPVRRAEWAIMDWSAAERIAREIQARIKTEVGEWLNSSVGVSWTKFLAKFASDIAPKKKVLLIDSCEKLHNCLKGRPLTDAWGINTRMEARLNAMGIYNLWDLKNYSADNLRRTMGRYGYYLWANVNGVEITAVTNGAPVPKSVGHSYCLPKKTTDKKYLSAILYKLCEKTGRRLRNLDREAKVIAAGWSYLRSGGAYKSWVRPEVMFTTEEIFSAANSFLENKLLLMPVRMLFVSVSRLTPVSAQMSLLEDNLSKKELSRALDRLNDKYGEYTVIRGAMWGTGDAARDRIGFRKTVDS